MPELDAVDRLSYRDHVIALAGPGGRSLGPARSRMAEWAFAHASLLDRADASEYGDAIRLAAQQGFVLRTEQVRDCGVSRAAERRLVRRCLWTPARRGVVCVLPPSAGRGVVDFGVHGNSVQVTSAAAALARPGTMVSHRSAAATYGLPVLGRDLRPQLTSMRDQTTTSDCLVIRGAGWAAEDVGRWFGVDVATVARTVIDLSIIAVAQGVVVADAALHEGLVTVEELRAARGRQHHRPGITCADRVIELADAASESPLESLVRLCLIDGGLPRPALQRSIATYLGTFRVDMLYEQPRVIIEADGELKYLERADLGATRDNPLVREKQRQEALEEAGYTVVRVSWRQVMHEPRRVVERVRLACRRASRAA